METPPISQPAPIPAPPAAMSLPARLLNVFATPGDVFADVKASPSCMANWVVPALLLIVVGWVSAFLILGQPAITQQLSEMAQQAIEKQIAKVNPPKQQAEQMRAMGEKIGGIQTKVMLLAGPVVDAVITPFFWGLVVWVFGAKLWKGNFGYMKGVEAAGLSNTIAVLEMAVRTLLVLALGNFFATPSLALLAKDMNPQNKIFAVLAIANVMKLWFVVVIAISLTRMSGVTFLKAFVFVFAVWFVYTGGLVGFGLLMQAAFGG